MSILHQAGAGSSSAPVVQAWGEWLLREWTWCVFFSGTFRDRVAGGPVYLRPQIQRGWTRLPSPKHHPSAAPYIGPGYAFNCWQAFVGEIGERVGHAPHWLVAEERGPVGGRFHLHGLLGGCEGLRRDAITGLWSYGWAWVEPVTEQRAMYVVKYAVKGERVRFSHNLSSRRIPHLVAASKTSRAREPSERSAGPLTPAR